MLFFDENEPRLLKQAKKPNILPRVSLNFLHYRLHFHIDTEFSALTDHTLNVDRPSHLFYNIFANW